MLAGLFNPTQWEPVGALLGGVCDGTWLGGRVVLGAVSTDTRGGDSLVEASQPAVTRPAVRVPVFFVLTKN